MSMCATKIIYSIYYRSQVMLLIGRSRCRRDIPATIGADAADPALMTPTGQPPTEPGPNKPDDGNKETVLHPALQ